MTTLKTLLIVTWGFFAIPAMADANVSFLQVEGMMLGFYPNLGDGIRVESQANSAIKFHQGRHCFDVTRSERSGLAFSGISFEQEERTNVRNKLTGLIGYPGVSTKELDEDWLKSATGLAADYYRDNLAKSPGDETIQLIFVPVVLAPKPLQIVKTEWTPEAKQVLDKHGWEALEQMCGSHFVEAVGEEDYVIYSIRIDFPNSEQRGRVETARLDQNNQSPGIVLNNLFRMNQRFEFGGPGHMVTIDVLSVGGREEDLSALRNSLANLNSKTQVESARNSIITRTQVSCAPGKLDPCQQVAQTFLDYQFGRINIKGHPPTFAPVRFRIAPLKYLTMINY